MLSGEEILREAVPDVLAALAGSLNPALVNALQEWVTSGDHQQCFAVAEILQIFNTGDAFYALSRELILQKIGEGNADSISTIRAAMWLPAEGL